jgi:hypothetical protein
MGSNQFIGDRKKPTMATIGALDTRLIAQPADPFITAGGRVSGFARATTFETTWIDIFAAAEQGTKQPYFFLWFRLFADWHADPSR